jgi:Holliday junction resolvasome RuvABC DNA-binding subunit
MSSNPNTPQPKPYLRLVGILKDADGRTFRASVTTSPDADNDEMGHAAFTILTCLGYDPDEVADAIHQVGQEDPETGDLPDYFK